MKSFLSNDTLHALLSTELRLGGRFEVSTVLWIPMLHFYSAVGTLNKHGVYHYSIPIFVLLNFNLVLRRSQGFRKKKQFRYAVGGARGAYEAHRLLHFL